MGLEFEQLSTAEFVKKVAIIMEDELEVETIHLRSAEHAIIANMRRQGYSPTFIAQQLVFARGS